MTARASRWMEHRFAERVAPAERAPVAWAALYGFCLMAGYYILRSVREEMGVQSGLRKLPWLFTATWVTTLVANPLYAIWIGRVTRHSIIAGVNRFFALNVLAFLAGFALLPPRGDLVVARVFFVWLTVFVLFAVSAFWGLMVDLFTTSQGRRLFGLISAGSTAGAIAGSAATAVLARHVGPVWMLAPAALLLELAARCVGRIVRATPAPCESGTTPVPPAADGPPTPGASVVSLPYARSVAPHARAADLELRHGGAFAGMQRTLSSRYLLFIAAYILLYAITSTYAYSEQLRLVNAWVHDSGRRTALFARIDLFANVGAVLVQALLTAPLLATLGVGLSLLLMPLFTAGGFVALVAAPGLGVLFWFQALRRALDFAVAKPARELLFTVVPRVDKYKAKGFIDTFVYRSADAIGAWMYALLPLRDGAPHGLLTHVLPISAAWGAVCVWLGRRHLRTAGAKSARPQNLAAAVTN
ncbi:MAG: MFS transporter [Phycisphaerae bacterium]